MGHPPVNETNNTTTGTGGNTLATNGLNESYGYDGFGNMLSAGNFNFMQSYTISNQLSGWNYDASGNLLIDGFNSGYAYDAEGRVSGEGQYVVGSPTYTFNPATTYVYDADGSRVAKTGSSAIDYIEFGGRQLARLSGGQWTDLIYGVSGLLAEVPGTQAGTPVYRMVDNLGSVAGTLNSSGTLLSSLDYAPFGQIFAGGTADPYVFTGKERDAESGNDYFGARYYASTMGRFMSPDWSASPSGVPYADLRDPQSLNLYEYVRNNPLSRTDPNGHWCVFGVIGSTCTPAPPPPPPAPDPAHVAAPKYSVGPGPGTGPGPSPAKRPRLSLTVGGGISANAEAGVGVSGVEANGAYYKAASINSDGKAQLGDVLAGGAVAYAGNNVAGAPSQDTTPPVVSGAFAGVGLSGFVANTPTVNDLSGPFSVTQFNIPLVSVQIANDKSGDWVGSFSIGPAAGLSMFNMTTTTHVSCELGCN